MQVAIVRPMPTVVETFLCRIERTVRRLLILLQMCILLQKPNYTRESEVLKAIGQVVDLHTLFFGAYRTCKLSINKNKIRIGYYKCIVRIHIDVCALSERVKTRNESYTLETGSTQ